MRDNSYTDIRRCPNCSGLGTVSSEQDHARAPLRWVGATGHYMIGEDDQPHCMCEAIRAKVRNNR